MRNLRTMLVFVLVAVAAGCGGPDTRVEAAVRAALAPETAPTVWAPALKDPSLTTEDIRKQMGTHNLTAFLLALSAQDADMLAKGYAWECASVPPDILARYLTDHSSLVAPKHISNLRWAKQSTGTRAGSFEVNTPYGLRAVLLFTASEKDGSIVVTTLAVAKKQSVAITEGFTIFKRP